MKKLRKGKCIHCLREDIGVDDDHVLPKSWYPRDFPEEIQLLTAPSCRPCNNSLGRLENDLRNVLALSLGKSEEFPEEIYQAALRSMNPNAGKSGKDRKRRAATRQRILSTMRPAERGVLSACLNGCGPDPRFPLEDHKVFQVPPFVVEAVCTKILKGVYWACANESYLDEAEYDVSIHHFREGVPNEFDEIIDNHSPKLSLELPRALILDGVFVPDTPLSTMMRMRVWGLWTWHACVTEKEAP